MSFKDVEITARDGGRFRAYLAQPHEPRGPVVVVLQEIFGINANIRTQTDDFAAAGYIAIAPDLFWRQKPGLQLDPAREDDRAAATALLKGLDHDLAIEDAIAALDYARTLPGANGRVASVGYCLGGKLSYVLSTRYPMDVCVSYYGVGIQGALDLAPQVKGKLLLHIAGEDHLCPPEAQAQIVAAMCPHGERIRVETYPGAGHAFARRGGAAYNAAAAERANAATFALLASLEAPSP